MDRIGRLHKAALQGDLAALNRLLQEDPLLLNRIESTFAAAGNPLHTASLRGDVGFATELLKLRPQLAEMRDEGGSYPIHLAAAGGHVGVLTQILGTKNSDLWRVRDKDGRTALHLAAANGRVGIMKELLRVDPELSGVVSNRGETALHMCLRKNQVEAAEVLVRCKAELVNVEDSEGNTVLHLATARKQLQMLELLLEKTQVDVNATNGCDCTALDILSQGPSECGDMEISHLLSSAGGKRNRIPRTTQMQNESRSPVSPGWKKVLKLSTWLFRKKDKNRLQETHNTLLIVATLIATVTFAAGLNPPGGVWQDSNNSAFPLSPPGGVWQDSNNSTSPSPAPSPPSPHQAGKAINESEFRKFKRFMYFDMSGLLSSLFIILFLVSGLPRNNHFTTGILVITLWVAVTSMTMAFVYGTSLVVVTDKISEKLFWVLVIWTGLMIILLSWHFIAAVFRLICLLLKSTPSWLRGAVENNPRMRSVMGVPTWLRVAVENNPRMRSVMGVRRYFRFRGHERETETEMTREQV